LGAGASAVICEDNSLLPDIPHAVVPCTSLAAGPLAQAIANWPARKLTAVGVTGTNGKTTVAALTAAILEAAGRPCGLLGTITYSTGARCADALNTTPGAVQLAELTAEMVAAGKSHLVMEASSHALDQDRTAGIDFDAAVLTNISGDHLDYHKTMDAYVAAKRKLFESLKGGAVAVINRDDAAGEEMAAAAENVLWYGVSSQADLRGRVERLGADGSAFAMDWRGREVSVVTPLIGLYNVYNCLAAAGTAIALGVDAQVAARALADVHCVPGRLQRVDVADFTVFVDYAHTDDALANVLQALRPICKGRLILVFGCGGDRDRTKRPRMAQVAEKHADRIIVTSDNPRGEPAAAIIEEIMAGFTASGLSAAEQIEDRATAISTAIAMAEAGDIVLIAGKGHENYQIIGDERRHFDDVQCARKAIAERGGGA